jgi:hypothetical protein
MSDLLCERDPGRLRKGKSVTASCPFAGTNRIRFKGLIGSMPISQAVSGHPSVLSSVYSNLSRNRM